MGRPKHGKESARTKACAKYKAEGRLILNKKAKADKIAAGKKIKSRKTPKTKDMIMNNMIRNCPIVKPYVDPNMGVIWGTSKDDKDSIQRALNGAKKGRKGKKRAKVSNTQSVAATA